MEKIEKYIYNLSDKRKTDSSSTWCCIVSTSFVISRSGKTFLLTLVIEHDVLWFKVTVDDALLMQVSQCHRNLRQVEANSDGADKHSHQSPVMHVMFSFSLL